MSPEIGPRGGSAGLLDRLGRPALLLALVSLGVGVVLAHIGGLPRLAQDYRAAYVVCLAIVALAFSGSAVVPKPSRRPKITYLAVALGSVTLGALALNGMAAGVSQIAFAVAAFLGFMVAGLAALVDVEAARDRPVSRL